MQNERELTRNKTDYAKLIGTKEDPLRRAAPEVPSSHCRDGGEEVRIDRENVDP